MTLKRFVLSGLATVLFSPAAVAYTWLVLAAFGAGR